MSNTTAECAIQVNGTQIRCQEVGLGSPVIILRTVEGSAASPLVTLLAQQFRVIVLEMPELPREESRQVADLLNQAATSIGLDQYVLIASAESVAIALWQAIEEPEHVDGLVLISSTVLQTEQHPAPSANPPESALIDRLGEIQAATLALFGTNDTANPPETGRMYVEQLPDCYYALMYDAGQDIEADRPQALYEAVFDFVERRGTFIVERNSTAINP